MHINRAGASEYRGRFDRLLTNSNKTSATVRHPSWGVPAMVGLTTILDDRFEEISRTMALGFTARLVVALITTVLMGLAVRPAVAAIWLGIFLAAEGWVALTLRPIADGRPGTPVQRLLLGLAGATTGSVWVASSAIYWSTGSHALQIVAACGFATILLSAQTQCARSLPMLIIVTVPSVLTLSFLALFCSGFHGLSLFMVAVSLVVLVTQLRNGAIIHRQETATLERLRQEAEAANQSKSLFLATMSHEIRTPMNGVLGMAHALNLTPLNEDQRIQIDMLMRSGDSLMTILNDILDVSKIEARRLTLESTSFDLCDVVSSVQALWREPAVEKGLELTCEIDPLVPTWVVGDPTRVRQILINHVSNAVKFTASGSVAIRVTRGDGEEIVFSVQDTGIGLTAQQQRGLFEAFSQADASITRRYGGTGLGLSISKQLAALMDGEIEVDSALGIGTEFRIRLQLPAAHEPPKPEQSAEFDLGRLRILVAEDNQINQAVVQAVLGATCAEVDIACDGEDALELLLVNKYDLVLMDIHMPRMGGIEALQQIRAGGRGRPDLPVIALTADAMTGDKERFLALGFDAVEAKPIRPANLLATIGTVVGAKMSTQALGGRPRNLHSAA